MTVSCGTKFHSDYMSYQLARFGLLERTITAHPRSKYLTRTNLSVKKISFLPPIFIFSYFFKKLLGNTNRVSKWLDYRTPLLFDKMAAGVLPDTHILISWAWSGLNSIKKIKAKGGIAIVEECGSCNSYQNELLKEEYSRLGLIFQYPTPDKMVKRELEEVALADYILCPSRHVAESFVRNGIPERKCVIIPYGVNLHLFKALNTSKKEFTALFVGTIGVRKGLIYLFEALKRLQGRIPIRCVLIGKLEEQFMPIFQQFSHLFEHIEKVAHQDLVSYYNNASVFVFPSLDEGMAYVQLEAMACGLPVICTPNSGGDSVVSDDVNGFIVPVRDAQAIAEKIEILYHDRDKLKALGENAQKATNEFTWDNYGSKLASFIKSISQT